ncbi:MAG: DNRLRE domain-containing protein [Paludibacteraceae bacterium]|nr:DNRLRE domain-containing protein [Paludibacteraceae bacterium]MBN2788004.1 DNRLRE domain-containing protein [Paludibacteraceae bacterium]
MKKVVSVLLTSTIVCFLAFTSCTEEPCDCNKKIAKTLVLNSASTITDTEIFSGQPTTPKDSSTHLGVAVWYWGLDSGQMKTLFQFNLSTISTTAIIKRATLTVQESDSIFNPSDTIFIYKITQAWNPALTTWNNPPVYDSTIKIIDLKDTIVSNTFNDYDITSLVQNWVNNPAQNFGMIMQIADQSLWHGYNICSIEEANATKRPKLIIEYEE